MTAGFDSEAQYVNQQNASGPVRAVHSYSGTAGGSVAATMQNIGGQRTVELIPGNPATRTSRRRGLIRIRAASRESFPRGRDETPGGMGNAPFVARAGWESPNNHDKSGNDCDCTDSNCFDAR